MKKLTKPKRQFALYYPEKEYNLKELQTLIGLVNFACLEIPSGRVFIRRLINLTIGVRRAQHRIPVTTETKKELRI